MKINFNFQYRDFHVRRNKRQILIYLENKFSTNLIINHD